MRRALSVLFATVAGLVLLASFHTTPTQTASGLPGEARSAVPTTQASQPAAGASPGGRDAFGSSPTSVPLSTVPPTTAPAAAGGTRVIDGPVEENRYGPVQVRVTLSGSKIVDVQALQLPSDRSRSYQISSVAGPELRQEALQAQNAQIHTVSGATYTSTGYRQSLQAALDQAGRP